MKKIKTNAIKLFNIIFGTELKKVEEQIKLIDKQLIQMSRFS